jgi:hypothetical protein
MDIQCLHVTIIVDFMWLEQKCRINNHAFLIMSTGNDNWGGNGYPVPARDHNCSLHGLEQKCRISNHAFLIMSTGNDNSGGNGYPVPARDQ